MKVLHVITDLGQGGAEAVLYRLIAASPDIVTHSVVSLRGMGYYGPRLQTLGVEVRSLDIKQHFHLPLTSAWRFHRLIVDASPDVVQTWMYHADLIGGMVARWAGVPVIWGIRHANLDANKNSLSTRLAARACAALSGTVPSAIACCSERARALHQGLGYCADHFTLIDNGYDPTCYRFDPQARRRWRDSLRLDSRTPLLGMVARWNPHKDHVNLLAALARLKTTGRVFHCLLVGEGINAENSALNDLIEHFGLKDRIELAGPRDDVSEVMNALDLHVLSSISEAFPNVVAEAMLCGTPCVVTDVGDTARIVGNTGWVVPPGDAGALARGIAAALDALDQEGRISLGERGRLRILNEFGLERMVAAYVALWRSVARRPLGAS